MRRALVLFLALVVATVFPALLVHAATIASPPESRVLQAPIDDHVPYDDALAVSPGPEAWIRESQPMISVLVTDEDFGPEIEALLLQIDDEALIPTWDVQERTIRAEPRGHLPDGPHRITLSMRDVEARVLEASWLFHLDTLPPLVNLDALPEVSEARFVNVTGTYTEENLKEIRVNEVSPIIEDGVFRVQVLLWPGDNEIQARAVDRSANVGLGLAYVSWLPPVPEDQTYETFLHANRSFALEFPSSWEVDQDFELETGARADVFASGPDVVGPRPTIIVFSISAGQSMDQGLFLVLMESTLVNLARGTDLYVVSRPAFRDLDAGTLSAQFSVLQTLPQGPRAFVFVTGFWSDSVRTVWLLVGSLSTEQVEEDWHAVQRAFETFTVIEPIFPPTESFDAIETSVNRALVVTVAAIVFILSFFSVILYRRRKMRLGRRDR